MLHQVGERGVHRRHLSRLVSAFAAGLAAAGSQARSKKLLANRRRVPISLSGGQRLRARHVQ